LGGRQEVRLSAGRSAGLQRQHKPPGASPGCGEKILDCVGVIRYYPEPEAESLRDSLAQYLEISPKNLLLGNGSVELLYAVSRELYRKGSSWRFPLFRNTAGG